MDTIDPENLACWSEGTWEGGRPESIQSFNNDSRRLEAGQLFVALKTGQRDGHDFLANALQAGAAGALVERFQADIDLPQLVVADVRKALLDAARQYRLAWRATTVGITGSCGKTTCKDVLSVLLGSHRVLRTEGNLNNLIGVPLSILKAEAKAAEFAVLEAGISEPGEMEQLAKAIDPDVAIVTAIGAAHLEDLKSVETVAREKGYLARGDRVQRTFLGATCEPYLKELSVQQGVVVKEDARLERDWSYRFTTKEGRSRLEQRIEGHVCDFEYAGTGKGLASNIALGIAAACSLGLSVNALREALLRWRPSALRGEWRHMGSCRVYADCYNANPVSMADSLATFLDGSPESEARLFLVGGMEELGEESERLHWELGRKIPVRKEDLLLVIGSEASSVLRGMKDAGMDANLGIEIKDLSEARERLAAFEGSVFLKGSRRYRLEQALVMLEEAQGERSVSC